MSTPPVFGYPAVAVEGDELVIRVSLDALCHGVSMSDNWPVQSDGQSAATIVDRELFFKEMMVALQRDNERGDTPLHLLFDAAAQALIEAGSEAIELHEDEDGDQ